MKKATTPQILAALGLALALPAALAWYYDTYVNWQPKLYPLAIVAVLLCCAALTLLTLFVRGETKKAFAWKTLLSVVVFAVVLVGVSGIVNNGIYGGSRPGPSIAAGVALPLATAQLLVLFFLLLRKLRKPVIAVCLAASCLLSSFFMIGVPWYMDNHYKAAIPALPEGRFAPMPELGEVNFTVPDNGSIEEVRDLIRETRASGEDKHFTVLIEDGEYNITQIAFDERDYDTTYRSRDGGVILNGGMSLPAEDFTPWEKNTNIKVIDLTKLGLGADNWGKMYSYGGGHSTAPKQDGGMGPLPCELFVDGRRQTIARYPNGKEWLKISDVLDQGDWCENYEDTIYGPAWAALRNPRGGTFVMDKETAARTAGWASIDDVWVFGCFRYEWADDSTPLLALDSAARTATMEYGSMFGYSSSSTYYFYNVLEELDEPGEWYLDRNSGLLYLWPPEGDLKVARIDISLSTETLIAGEGVKNLSFIGLTVQGTRGSAMALTGDNITVSHCTVQNVARNAIAVTGYGNTVSNNTVRNIGAEGITIDGGDAETLTAGNNRVVNNLVHDWAQLMMTYQGGIRLGGTGNLAAHNELHSAPHSAMFFGGNNHVIEHNLIYNVCMETDDAGAMYSGRSWYACWGTVVRNNVIYDLGNPGRRPDGIYLDDGLAGVTVENNLLVNVSGLAIHISGRDLEVHGNIAVNAGRPVSYDDRTRQGALFGGWYEHAVENGHQWQALWASPWQTDTWREAYPKLAAYTDDFSDADNPSFAANPANSSVTGNIFVGPNKPNYAESVRRFSEIGPNEEYGAWKGWAYWTLPGYEMIEIERVGRIGQ